MTTSSEYRFPWSPGGSLLAIDPASPTAPLTVDTNVVIAMVSYGGTYDAGSHTFTTQQALAAIYVKNGQIWRVFAQKSAGAPGSNSNPPVRVSNETEMTGFCSFRTIDGPTLADARVLYELPGADQDCLVTSDNIVKFVPILANSTTTPTALPAGMSIGVSTDEVFDVNTGLPTAFFVTDYANNASLKIVNLNTLATATIQANTTITTNIIAQDTSDRVWLRSPTTLYVYTVSSNTLTPIATTTGTFSCEFCADNTAIYLYDSAGVVRRIPLTATNASAVSTLYTSSTAIRQLALTTNRVMLGRGTSGFVDVVAVPKAGGAASTILTSTSTDQFQSMDPAGTLLFTESVNPTTQVHRAGVVGEDGTPVASFANSMWRGYLFQNANSRTRDFDLKTIVRVAAGPTPSSPYVGASLVAHNTASPLTSPVTLGNVPTLTPSLTEIAFFGFTDNAVAGEGLIGQNLNTTIWWADTTVANSLSLVPAAAAQWIVQ